MNAYGSYADSIYSTLLQQQISNMILKLTGTLLFMSVALLVIRIIMAYFISKRGNMILISRGIKPESAHLFGFALFMALFFGTLISYIFVFWFATALPTIKPVADIAVPDEDEEDNKE